MASRALLALLLLLSLAPLAPAQGKVFLSTSEALDLAFPKCEIKRVKHVLDERQRERVEQLSGHAHRRAMVIVYEARRDGELVGTAYFDRHRVRSLNEVVMIVVRPDGRVARTEVLSFGEPVDYLPRTSFYAQFVGRALDDELDTKRQIRGVTGCTLTVCAMVACVRRVLAVHRVLYPTQRAEPAPEPVDEPDDEPADEPGEQPEPGKQQEPAGERERAAAARVSP